MELETTLLPKKQTETISDNYLQMFIQNEAYDKKTVNSDKDRGRDTNRVLSFT